MIDEKAIYEWLGYVEPYKVKYGMMPGWFSHFPKGGSSVFGIHPLPPLDMNLWHGEVVLKLLREPTPVVTNTWSTINAFCSAGGRRAEYGCRLHQLVNDSVVKGKTEWLEISGTLDYYALLTKYLHEVKQ